MPGDRKSEIRDTKSEMNSQSFTSQNKVTGDLPDRHIQDCREAQLQSITGP